MPQPDPIHPTQQLPFAFGCAQLIQVDNMVGVVVPKTAWRMSI